MEDLKELAKPIIKQLKEKHHPYVEVVITQDGVKVKETIESIPSYCVDGVNIDTAVDRLNNKLHQSLSENFNSSDNSE